MVTSEIEDLSPSSNKFVNICPFCKSDDFKNNVSLKAGSKIRLCKKHSRVYTCLAPDCQLVFPTLDVFLQHYRFHLDLPSNDSMCHSCFQLLNDSKIFMTTEHKHQDLSELMTCCSETFSSMTDFALHKIIRHSATVSMIHLEVSAGVTTCNPKYLNKCLKDEPEICAVKNNMPGANSIQSIDKIYSNAVGSYSCKICNYKCVSVMEFIEHSEKKHNLIFPLKESGIKLCPICELNYSIENFDEHVVKCTNTMVIGNNLPLNHYGCIICKATFDDITPKEFRCHFLFCKSFQKASYVGKVVEYCINCNFRSDNQYYCIVHANSCCIHFKLRMKYAMGPFEKIKVETNLISINNDNEDNYEVNSDSVNIHYSSLSNPKIIPLNEVQDTTRIKLCDGSIRKKLGDYNYFCNYCKKSFYSSTIFHNHLIDTGELCRPISLWYCENCLTDFNDSTEYEQHLKPTEAPDKYLKIKGEPESDPNEGTDYGDDNILDVPEIQIYHSGVCFDEKLSAILQRQTETPSNKYLPSSTLVLQEPGPSRPINYENLLFQESDYSNDQEPEYEDEDKGNISILDWN